MKNSFIHNAFHLLGADITSTQREIATKVSNAGKFLAIGEDIQHDDDLFLSTADRTPKLIKESESRLADPVDRLTDSFFWFVISTGDDSKIFDAVQAQDKDFLATLYESGDSFQRKNAAIGQSIIFEHTQKKTDFESALKMWAGILGDETFWNNWVKLYKSYDYLDTSERLIESFRRDIHQITAEKFFAVSKLDDAVDAQIVDKYIKVPEQSFEKTLEPHILQLREMKIRIQKLRTSPSLLTEELMVNQATKDEVNVLAGTTVDMQKQFAADKLLQNSKVTHELDTLIEQFLSLVITAHNRSMSYGEPLKENLQFMLGILALIEPLSTNPIVRDRIRKNNLILRDFVRDDAEFEQGAPHTLELYDLQRKLDSLPDDNTLVEYQGTIGTYLEYFRQRSAAIQSAVRDAGASPELLISISLRFHGLATQINNFAQGILQTIEHSVKNSQQPSSAAQNAIPTMRVAREHMRFAQFILVEIAHGSWLSFKQRSSMAADRSIVSENIRQVSVLLRDAKPGMYEASTYATKSVPSSGGCYIATHVYGTYDSPELWMLRRFRDTVLAQSVAGRAFIRMYYAVSPAAIKKFGQRSFFNKVARAIVTKAVSSLEARHFSKEPYSGV